MIYLNPPMVKKTSEEIRNRKPEASENMGVKNNRFIHSLMRKIFPIRSLPMDYFPRLKEMLFYETKEIEIGTLSQSPPVRLRFISSNAASLPLPNRLLGRHGNVEEMNPSRFTLEG